MTKIEKAVTISSKSSCDSFDLKYLKNLYCCCVCVHMCIYDRGALEAQRACGGQKTALQNQFSGFGGSASGHACVVSTFTLRAIFWF